MNAAAAQLPPGYEALEPFVARWLGATAADRDRLRSESTPAEREAFYAAAQGLLAPALASLDAKPLELLDEREQRLLRLLLAFAHVAQAVELQRDAEPVHAAARRHMRITRASADQ